MGMGPVIFYSLGACYCVCIWVSLTKNLTYGANTLMNILKMNFIYYFIAPGGESDTLAVLDETACQKCIEANRDVIVGVKVRLTAAVCGQGKTEEEAYR